MKTTSLTHGRRSRSTRRSVRAREQRRKQAGLREVNNKRRGTNEDTVGAETTQLNLWRESVQVGGVSDCQHDGVSTARFSNIYIRYYITCIYIDPRQATYVCFTDN